MQIFQKKSVTFSEKKMSKFLRKSENITKKEWILQFESVKFTEKRNNIFHQKFYLKSTINTSMEELNPNRVLLFMPNKFTVLQWVALWLSCVSFNLFMTEKLDRKTYTKYAYLKQRILVALVSKCDLVRSKKYIQAIIFKLSWIILF